ncbi:acyl-CoA dehydrogenase family protein [Pseudomonas huanghezhanensis]|uniref:acyl-CoA dehydrogenase family protein n=1 Tax=Pseudomonas huanghezhanensis TaxID=3002903 RepID=UPI002286081C|nr:acyl-CoA dehydrogenase family protein [Pseudomonas sp. BSw22131]
MSRALSEFLAQRTQRLDTTQALGECLRALVHEQLASLPPPGGGRTLERWRSLAIVAAHDLALCKLYEGHTDALAIMAELKSSAATPGSTWGMWAAEPPQARVMVSGTGRTVSLNGRKAWCSGATTLSHALMTAWDNEARQQLVAVALDQPGVTVTDEGWAAVGMAATGSVEVQFDNAQALTIGEPGQYVSRAGFWQGGIGIAACWYGAANSIAERLLNACAQREEPHALAHLGAVDAALFSAGQALQNAARAIDQAPLADAELLARRCRAVVERTTQQVIEHVGRALGAGPYCKDAQFARLMADLPVFVRQSHAERDLAALGQLLACSPSNPSTAATHTQGMPRTVSKGSWSL